MSSDDEEEARPLQERIQEKGINLEESISDADSETSAMSSPAALSPEFMEMNIGKFFAVRYDKPKQYYWGKLLNVEFVGDADDESQWECNCELSFLQKKIVSANPEEIRYDWPIVTDMDTVHISRCFYGPAVPIVDGKHLKFDCECVVKDFF